jgi:uncharacterized repeat protein (TIGR04052 family)
MRRTLALTGLFLAGCGSESPTTTLSFRAVVGSQPFSCAQTYSGVGSDGGTFVPADFRLYVHDVALVDRSGNAHPLAMSGDPEWQDGQIALLDFEDASGACTGGTPETHTVVQGRMPAGDYTGLRFTVGVPTSANLGSPAKSAPPLNLPAMYWGWGVGYAFIKVADPHFPFMLSWSGCTSDPQGTTETCTHPNQPVIDLSAFDAARDVVQIDAAALFAGVALHTPGGLEAGCMGGPPAHCVPIFHTLGLQYDQETAPTGQTVFTAVSR